MPSTPRPFTPGVLLTLDPGPGTLLALDIDGTILGHDGSLTPGVVDVIGELAASGAHIVIATGRSIPAVIPVLAQLGLENGWAVCSNGAVTIRYREPEDYVIEDVVTFNPGPALRRLRKFAPDAIYAVEEVGKGFKLSQDFPLGELAGEHEIVSFEELCNTAASRVTVRGPNQSAADFHELVRESGLHGVSYAVGWTAWLDVSPEGVSKASALEVIRQRLGVDRAHTFAAGDGHNDIEMFGWAEYAVAMGDADEHTRGAADYVTGPVNEDGLVPVLASVLGARVGQRY